MKLSRLIRGLPLILVPLTVLAGSAPKTIGTFKAWNAATYTDDGIKVCYMVSRPADSTPKNVNRGDIYFMVERRAGMKHEERVSLRIGYTFRPESRAEVRIGAREFSLSTREQYAWPPDDAASRRLITAMRRGQDMTVQGVSSRGTQTTDEYSLLGFTAAHRAIGKACP